MLMSNKRYAVFVPLLAAVAFAVIPAVAQAAPEWYACQKVAAKTAKFTKINCKTEKAESNFEKVKVGEFPGVTVISANVLGKEAVLTAAAGGITCKKIADKGVLWNEELESGVVGRAFNVVKFSECTATGGLVGCTISQPIRLRVNTALTEEGGKIYNVYSPSPLQ